LIRTLWGWWVTVWATIWYGSRIMWAAFRRSPALPCVCEELPRAWARTILRAGGITVALEGAEVIDPDAPQVLVANHVSWFDVLALVAYVPGKYRFVAKKELESVPFFGPAWQACGHISIDRQDRTRAIASLAEARRGLEEERPTVIIFPEGTRSRDGRLGPFKKGAFVLAVQAEAPLIPAAILGTHGIMPKGSWRIRSGHVVIRFGAPIPAVGLGMNDRDELARKARDAVSALAGANG